MKRQLIINTIIGLSLLAVGLYVARNTYWDWDEVRVPPGEEAQLDPYYATRHFLGSLGIHTSPRLRERRQWIRPCWSVNWTRSGSRSICPR
ncbi:MAG: hypothetical protein U1F35_18155 [Steroidobacteraceae bacterium]